MILIKLNNKERIYWFFIGSISLSAININKVKIIIFSGINQSIYYFFLKKNHFYLKRIHLTFIIIIILIIYLLTYN